MCPEELEYIAPPALEKYYVYVVSNIISGLDVIKLEYSIKLKKVQWLAACGHLSKFYNLEASWW